MKKTLALIFTLLLAVTLVACKKDDPSVPVITGASDAVVEVGTAFDKLAGVKATDAKDGDLTSKIVVTGEVNVNVEADYTLTYTVKNSADKEGKVTRKVSVVASRLYAEGAYNYRFETSELRNAFFGAAEKHLLENVYGGVPLFVNSGMSIYSSRVSLPVSEYVPVMGWGSQYGTLTEDDLGKTFSDSTVGKAGEYTFRGAFSSNPSTFNQWLSDDSVSSDALEYMIDSLYAFQYNADKTGYEINPSMAAELPVPVGGETRPNGQVVSKKWTVEIKDDLEWAFHPGTDKTGLDTEINAKSFVDTFKFALDNKWFRAIDGGSHFWATSSPVKGAKAYYDGTARDEAAWEDVGLQVSEDGKSIEFEFTSELSDWNILYWLSSNTMSPVHLGLINKLGVDGAKDYGTTPEKMAFTGPYLLSNFQQDKSLRYTKNANFHSPNLRSYTGYNFTIVERSEIIFAEFEAGNLDVAGIPLTKYDQYKDNSGIKRTPGATTFRMNVNALGTKAEQESKFPGSKHTPEPLLANLAFRQAMYFGVDRKTLAYDVLKTSDPGMFLFSNAYLVDATEGVAFRDTPAGKLVGADLSQETHGFVPSAAKALFKQAVAELIASGDYEKGTAANPTVIKLEVVVQAASTAQDQLGSFIKAAYEDLFNDEDNHVKVEIIKKPVAFPDLYYDYQLVGEFDLGMGGISGSALDAASFLEVFASDNRGGFTLNWGFDSSLANIPVTYTLPSTGKEITEYWSFDGIVSVLNGDIQMSEGVEVLDRAAIDRVEGLIEALPAVADLVLTDYDDVMTADDALWGLTPRVRESIASELVDKLNDAYDKVVGLKNVDTAAKLEVNIGALPAVDELTVATDAEDIEELIKTYKARGIAALVSEANANALIAAYVKVTDLALGDIPTTITLANAGTVSGLRAQVKDVLGLDDAAVLANLNKLEAAEVGVVVAIIADLPAVADIVLTSRYQIQEARAAYKALLAAQPDAVVSNKSVLEAAEAEVKPLVDTDEAKDVTNLIGGLPSANDADQSHLVQVQAARAAYDKLSDEAKLEVGNLNKLVALEAALA